MEHNPYAPPRAGVTDARTARASEVSPVALVYTHNQVAVATLLGTVFAGGWMMASNYRVMGMEDQARQAMGWSMAGYVILLAVIVVSPDPSVDLGVLGLAAAVCAIALRAWSETRFGRMVERHLAAGGTQFNWGRVVGLGLLFLAILFSLAYLVAIVLSEFGISVR
jgi:hypothetical protein